MRFPGEKSPPYHKNFSVAVPSALYVDIRVDTVLLVDKPAARSALQDLVGAGRFERPTPCAQGRFRPVLETAHFLALTFQADAETLLNIVELFGT